MVHQKKQKEIHIRDQQIILIIILFTFLFILIAYFLYLIDAIVSLAIIIMADDFQSMLNTMGQKFDMSFDQGDHQPQKSSVYDHQKSINPQNRNDGTSCIQTQQNPTQYQKQEKNKLQPSPHLQEKYEENAKVQQRKAQNEVPFLPLNVKQYGQPQEGEQYEDKPVLLQGQTGGQFSCEQQQMEYYRSLSQKFEAALNNAHSRKSLSTCGRGQFMERQEHYLRRKKAALTHLLQQKERREKGHTRVKPLINSYSQQMLHHHKPIEQRYPAVLAERKRKVEVWVAQKKRAEEQAKLLEQQLMDKWREEVKERVGEVRSVREYFQSQQRWSEQRNKNIQENGRRQDQSLRAEASFRPKINQRSDNMMKKKAQRVPIYEKQPQIKKLPSDPNCTFKPNLSKTLKRIP